MKRVAKFEKVSFEQYLKDHRDTFCVDFLKADEIIKIREIYDNITLPKRGTKKSCGYDFVSPISFDLHPNERIKIPTGIRVDMNENYALFLFVRSNVGFKYETILTNGTGLIDADYFFANNEGHIFAKLRNDGERVWSVKAGDRFVQGVFLPYGITIDDEADGERFGGIGSTGV